MIKIGVICLLTGLLLSVLWGYETVCRHKLVFDNRTSFPVNVSIEADRQGKSFDINNIVPDQPKIYRVDLSGFEGDLLINIQTMQQEKWSHSFEVYTYQGDPSDYYVSITDNPAASEIKSLDQKQSIFNTLKFFFVSFARYNGCILAS